jgi:hypothetical protein
LGAFGYLLQIISAVVTIWLSLKWLNDEKLLSQRRIRQELINCKL